MLYNISLRIKELAPPIPLSHKPARDSIYIRLTLPDFNTIVIVHQPSILYQSNYMRTSTSITHWPFYSTHSDSDGTTLCHQHALQHSNRSKH